MFLLYTMAPLSFVLLIECLLHELTPYHSLLLLHHDLSAASSSAAAHTLSSSPVSL